MAYLHSGNLSPRSISLYLSALRFCHITSTGQDPRLAHFSQLHYVLRGIRRCHPELSRPRRLPITPAVLQILRRSWSVAPVTFDRVMLWAACLLGFFGFLRSGEFTSSPRSPHNLEPTDIAVDNRSDPTYITVKLRRHKTDQHGIGTTIVIGRTGTELCPVAAVLSYLAWRPASPGPLFIQQDGTPLTRSSLVAAVREALTSAGLDVAGYNGHSFRIGAASTAARAGLPDSLIQSLGRWKSAAFLRYIRVPTEQLISVSSTLVGSNPHTSTC